MDVSQELCEIRRDILNTRQDIQRLARTYDSSVLTAPIQERTSAARGRSSLQGQRKVTFQQDEPCQPRFKPGRWKVHSPQQYNNFGETSFNPR